MEKQEQEYDAFDAYLEDLELKLHEATLGTSTSTSSSTGTDGSTSGGW